MDPANLPWEKGTGVVLAVALLAILIDCVYRKIPRGFRLVRRSVDKTTHVLVKRHEEGMVAIREMHEKMAALHEEIKLMLARQDARKRNPREKRRTKA